MAETVSSRALIYTSPAQLLEIYRLQQTEGRLSCLRIQHFRSFEDCQIDEERYNAQKRLSHESICEVYSVEIGSEAGLWELRVEMEWCGRDLASLTHTEHFQGWEESFCAWLLGQVVWALAYAQEKEVSHRHIQPSSLFLTDSGLLKITGFGCAKALESCALGHTVTGTPLFLCPIRRKTFTLMVLGEEIGQTECCPYKSDVYSLGLTVVYLLQPAALPILGNQAKLLQTIAALPIHPKFQDVLSRMLEPEEPNRPDFPSLAAYLQAASSPPEEPPIPPASPPEVADQSAAKNKTRRLRIVKKPAEAVPGPPDLLAKASDALEVQAPSNQRRCPCCLETFSLALTDSWRMDLVGSSHCEVARNYCSLACFKRECEDPAPQSSERELAQRDLEEEGAEGQRLNVQCVVILNRRAEEQVEQFLHCFQHSGLLPLRGNIIRATPTVLAQCPDCPAGELSRLPLPQVNKWVVRNSLYASLIFMEMPLEGYVLLSEKALPALDAGLCHFCSGSVNPCNWLGFFHNKTLALVCSFECLSTAQRHRNCPSCEAPLPAVLPESFPGSSTAIMFDIDEASSYCDLCFCGDNDYTLGCGHTLCHSCLDYIPRLDIPLFSCLLCGRIHCKADYEGLF